MLKKFIFSIQHNYDGPFVLAIDETPHPPRPQYDRHSGHITGGPITNDRPFQTEEELNQFLQTMGNLDNFPKSALWGAIACIGIKSVVCPVFCIPTPLTKGVTNEYLTTFTEETLMKAEEAGCKVTALSTDGDPRWRAYAKNNLKKPNYPADGLYTEINHPDAIYFAPHTGSCVKIIINDAEHLLKVFRNQITSKNLILGPCVLNMFWLEEVRVDNDLNNLAKLSISDTNVQVGPLNAINCKISIYAL